MIRETVVLILHQEELRPQARLAYHSPSIIDRQRRWTRIRAADTMDGGMSLSRPRGEVLREGEQ